MLFGGVIRETPRKTLILGVLVLSWSWYPFLFLLFFWGREQSYKDIGKHVLFFGRGTVLQGHGKTKGANRQIIAANALSFLGVGTWFYRGTIGLSIKAVVAKSASRTTK